MMLYLHATFILFRALCVLVSHRECSISVCIYFMHLSRCYNLRTCIFLSPPSGSTFNLFSFHRHFFSIRSYIVRYRLINILLLCSALSELCRTFISYCLFYKINTFFAGGLYRVDVFYSTASLVKWKLSSEMAP